MNNANDQKPTPEQQGAMENLLDSLDAQSELLSTKELKEELESRGIDTEKFLDRTSRIIKDAKEEHFSRSDSWENADGENK